MKNAKPIELPGRTLWWIAEAETDGTQQMSICKMRCEAGSRVKSAHRHTDVEEVLYILSGKGEAWIDGCLTAFEEKDIVVFPPNSLHQVRNTGSIALEALCIYGHPNGKSTYVTTEFDAFEEE